MNFLDKLEFKYGRYAIRNLHIYICAIHIIGLLIQMFNPYFYYQYLSLDSMMLLKGQVWRIFTFLFYPPYNGSFILISALIIHVYYTLSASLIMVWGSFKFNLYLLIGVIGHVVAAIVLGLLRIPAHIYPVYLMFSIFIAYSLTFGDATFFLFFFIPVKAKYLALFEIAIYIYIFIYSGFVTRISILLSLINVILFIYLLYKGRYGGFKNFMNQLKNEISNSINDIKHIFRGGYRR
jgi:hypothetical protein